MAYMARYARSPQWHYGEHPETVLLIFRMNECYGQLFALEQQTKHRRFNGVMRIVVEFHIWQFEPCAEHICWWDAFCQRRMTSDGRCWNFTSSIIQNKIQNCKIINFLQPNRNWHRGLPGPEFDEKLIDNLATWCNRTFMAETLSYPPHWMSNEIVWKLRWGTLTRMPSQYFRGVALLNKQSNSWTNELLENPSQLSWVKGRIMRVEACLCVPGRIRRVSKKRKRQNDEKYTPPWKKHWWNPDGVGGFIEQTVIINAETNEISFHF